MVVGNIPIGKRETNIMYCPNCGTRLDDDARFCDHCGTTLAHAAPTPADDSIVPAASVDANPYNRRALVVVGCVILAAALAVGGVYGVHQWMRVRAANAAADCTSAVKALADADDKVMDRLTKPSELSNTPDDEVADPKTVDTLNTAISRVDPPSRKHYECPVGAKLTDLEATAKEVKTIVDRRNRQLAAVDKAASAVEASKAAKSFDSAKKTLSSKIDEAKSVLDSSAGKVDDEAVRDALQRSIDNAEKTFANATPKTTQQVVDSLNDVSKSVDAVKQAVSDHEAKLEANRCAAYAGHYVLTQGDDEFTLNPDCSMSGGDSNGEYTWHASAAAGSVRANTDGSISWSVSGVGAYSTAIWRKAGVIPQWMFDSYGESAPQLTGGRPTIELKGEGNALYSQE